MWTLIRLTQLYNISLLFYYWLQVSASADCHKANIYKKLKNVGAYITLYGGPLRPKLVANSRIKIKYYIVVSEGIYKLFYFINVP